MWPFKKKEAPKEPEYFDVRVVFRNIETPEAKYSRVEDINSWRDEYLDLYHNNGKTRIMWDLIHTYEFFLDEETLRRIDGTKDEA